MDVMKTIKLFFTVTAMVIGAIATAVEKPKMNVIPLTADKMIISASNEKAAFFEFSVKTLDGNILYYKRSNARLTDYRKIFDVENLKNGKYVLDLRVNDTRLSQGFEVFNSEIKVGDKKLIYDPYFSFKDGILKLSYLNFDEELLNFKLYDNNDDLIYQTKVGSDFVVSTGYDISKLQNGSYRAELSSYVNRYSYDFEK